MQLKSLRPHPEAAAAASRSEVVGDRRGERRCSASRPFAWLTMLELDLRLAGADDPAHKARYADVLQAELSFLSRRLGPPRRLGLSA